MISISFFSVLTPYAIHTIPFRLLNERIIYTDIAKKRLFVFGNLIMLDMISIYLANLLLIKRVLLFIKINYRYWLSKRRCFCLCSNIHANYSLKSAKVNS